jgi:hypothetical protein
MPLNLTLEQIDAELARRERQENIPVPQAPSPFTLEQIDAELARREDPSFLQQAAVLGKGALSGFLGAIPDTAALIYNLPAMLQNYQVGKQREFKEKHPDLYSQMERHYGQQLPISEQLPLIPSTTEAIEKGIENVGGEYVETPESMRNLYEAAKLTGAVGGAGGISKGIEKVGAKVLPEILPQVGNILGKFGTTKPAELAGAAAAGYTLPSLEEYGPIPALVGSAAAGALTTKGVKGIKKISDIGKSFKEVSKEGFSPKETTIGAAISLMGEPSHAIENVISKYKLNKVPFNVRLQGPVAYFVGNAGLNTMFRARQYTKNLEEAPKEVVNTVIKEINKIHPKNLGAQGISQDTTSFIRKEQELVDKQASELYKKSYSSLKAPDEKTNVHPLAKAMEELKDELIAPDPSEAQKFVIEKINRFAASTGILKKVPPPTGMSEEAYWQNPALYEAVMKSLKKKPQLELPIMAVDQQRQAWLDATKYGKVRGVKAKIGKLIGAATQSILNSDNKEFVNNWNAARTYYRLENAGRVFNDLARALTTETAPKEAYAFMTDPRKINQLSHIIGPSPKGKQIFNALKRAKLNDVLVDKIKDQDGRLRAANFSSLFEKGNENQDLLRSLLGKENYKGLKEISELSKSFSKSASEFRNFSGTTTIGVDIARLGLVAGGLADIVLSGGTGLFLSGVGAIAAPYVASRILSNPRYVDAAVKFGLSVKNKNVQGATHYNNRMRDIFYDTLKREAPQFLSRKANAASHEE